MRVLFASSEVAPFSKTGGLGDVAGALPRALARVGVELLVVSPWYAQLGGSRAPYWIGDTMVPFAGQFEPVGVGVLEENGVTYAFVGHPDYSRDSVYGYHDDARRFARFTRAVPQVAERLGFAPNVIHANDWHTGTLPLLLARAWHLPPGFPYLPSIFTLHNAQFQGEAPLPEMLHWLRLGEDAARGYLDHHGNANSVNAALGFATHVTTVSPSYAEELTLPEYGFGLEGTFRSVRGKLTGILNGIDTASYDPSADPAIAAPYSVSDLSGRERCKAAVTDEFRLLEAERPLLAVVSRFAHQKGIDLVLKAGNSIVNLGFNLLLLGSGDPGLEASARRLAERHPGRVAAVLGFDERLARRLYAGADALLVPSRFEPCGLTQLLAMRYGALPVARATGGLKDTVEDGVTGFLFREATVTDLLAPLKEALSLYGTSRWREMQLSAMRRDYSWDASARKYADLYASVLPSNS